MENGQKRDADLDAVVSHIFEFNSILPKGISELKFDNSTYNKQTFTINFDVPNAFQGSFKTSFKGLRNNTSDPHFILDSNSTKRDGEYNASQFEISKSQFQTPINGVYNDL